VLGPPTIDNAQASGRPLRSAAIELMVYLAVHAEGATPEQIQEDLWPYSRARLAATKLHTAASNLRHTLAAAAGAPTLADQYVRKHRGRYRLHTVEVDLWQLRQACAQARTTTDPQQRLTAQHHACRYPGELAAGCNYEWITPHREGTRTLALDAHTSLAAAITNHDPTEAARLLTAAVDINPMAEPIYRQAMHAWHRLGQPEPIQDLLRQLIRHLEDIEAEPDDETLALAARLRHDLEHQHQQGGLRAVRDVRDVGRGVRTPEAPGDRRQGPQP
jgi:DNA-binding SARP family transcriptional activator